MCGRESSVYFFWRVEWAGAKVFYGTPHPVFWADALAHPLKQTAKGKRNEMRTPQEILDRIKVIEPEDFLGWERTDLIKRLPFEYAKPFLAEGATQDDWDKRIKPLDKDSILSEMLDYMPFAWEKANNFRGLSALRSMAHYSVWVWLLGDDFGDLMDYEFYGKDNLAAICQHYGWDSSQWDDGVRLNAED